MNDNQIHTSESQLQQRCADLEKDNARLREAIEELERRKAFVEFAYDEGYVDGLTAFALWKDGEQFVGSCGTLLRNAVQERKEAWNYNVEVEQAMEQK